MARPPRAVAIGVLVLTLWCAAEAAAPAETATDPARPAPTSVDRLVCTAPAPAAAPALGSAPGTTSITFTLVEPGCA